MVTKPLRFINGMQSMFESCVVLDGDKTWCSCRWSGLRFESCVVLDGDKTRARRYTQHDPFESCAVLDGDKTRQSAKPYRHNLVKYSGG